MLLASHSLNHGATEYKVAGYRSALEESLTDINQNDSLIG